MTKFDQMIHEVGWPAVNMDTEAKLQFTAAAAAAWKANPIKLKHFGYRFDHHPTPQSFHATLLKGPDDKTLADTTTSSGVELFDVTLVLMERYYTYFPESGCKHRYTHALFHACFTPRRLWNQCCFFALVIPVIVC
jgi:hypothetical protein